MRTVRASFCVLRSKGSPCTFWARQINLRQFVSDEFSAFHRAAPCVLVRVQRGLDADSLRLSRQPAHNVLALGPDALTAGYFGSLSGAGAYMEQRSQPGGPVQIHALQYSESDDSGLYPCWQASYEPLALVSIWQVAAALIALCGCGSGASACNVAAPALVKCHPSLRFKRDSKQIERGECALQAVNTRGEHANLGC